MSFTWAPIDPDEIDFGTHNWGPRLNGDAVAGQPEALVDSGTLTIDSTIMEGDVQKVWMSGGVTGDVKLTLRVNTVGGRVLDEGIKIKVKER